MSSDSFDFEFSHTTVENQNDNRGWCGRFQISDLVQVVEKGGERILLTRLGTETHKQSPDPVSE